MRGRFSFQRTFFSSPSLFSSQQAGGYQAAWQQPCPACPAALAAVAAAASLWQKRLLLLSAAQRIPLDLEIYMRYLSRQFEVFQVFPNSKERGHWCGAGTVLAVGSHLP